MTNSILKQISSRLNGSERDSIETRRANVQSYLSRSHNNPRPSYKEHYGSDFDMFCKKAEKSNATVHLVGNFSEIPQVISSSIIGSNDKSNNKIELFVPTSKSILELNWSKNIHLRTDNPDISSSWGLSIASAAAAETATLFLTSGDESPITLNFVPENSIVILSQALIFQCFEDAMDETMKQNDGLSPRAISMITGPSRTADIAQQLVMGAHGPKTLNIILV